MSASDILFWIIVACGIIGGLWHFMDRVFYWVPKLCRDFINWID